MHIDLTEFRSAYLAEADEHLAVANARLIEIEAAAKAGTGAPREMRELLRILHTIKGLSAMVGIEPIVTLSHRMESVLRAVDAGRPTERAIEVLFAGARAIEVRLAALAKGEAVTEPPAELLAALDAIDIPPVSRRAGTVAIDPALAAKMSAADLEQIGNGVSGGRRVAAIDFAPSAERAGRGLTITSIRERLERIAEIVKVIPLSGAGGLVFVLVVLTDRPNDQIASELGIELGDVRELLAAGSEIATAVAPIPIELEIEAEVSRAGAIRVDVGRIDDAIEKLAALVVTRSRLERAIARLAETGVSTRELDAIMTENARQLKDLRSSLIQVRMVPIAAVLDRLPLVVRGLARSTKKEVALVIDGASAELDKTVGDRLFPAIVHLLRNAVDHGIESPEERRRLGKPERATIVISAASRSNRQVTIEISDDGRGVDAAAVARKAGVDVPRDAATLLALLCRPGFSTRDAVDTTSGRGMGMDIVKRIVVDGLGGDIALTTEAGRGTTFTLRVPLTIAIIDAFAVRCGVDRFVVPVPIVDEIVDLTGVELVRSPGVDLMSRRGEAIPVVDLRIALGMERGDARAMQALVVRRAQRDPIAFAVERVTGRQEAVVRPLDDALVRVPGVSGSTDLGDGRATLVLDLLGLSAKLQAEERAA